VRLWKNLFRASDDNEAEPGVPAQASHLGARGADRDFNAIAAVVRDCAADVLGILPSSDLGRQVPLRDFSGGLYQLDLVQVIELVEEEFGVAIEDADWALCSTPNWEACTVNSIAEIVQQRLGGSPAADTGKGRTGRTSDKSSVTARAAPRQAQDDMNVIRGGERTQQAPDSSVFRTIAMNHARAGNLGAATETLEVALVLLERDAQPGNEAAASVICDLARLYLEAGLFVRVRPSNARQELYERAVQLCSLGVDRPSHTLAQALAALSKIERGANRPARANWLSDRALAAARTVFGDGDPRTEPYLYDRAVLALEYGDVAIADTLFGEAVAVVQIRFGAGSREVSETLERQAAAYAAVGEYDRAEWSMECSIAIRNQVAPRSYDVAVAVHTLARLYFRRRDYKGARGLMLQALNIMIDVTVPAARQEELRRQSDSPFPDNFLVEREAAILDATARKVLCDLTVAWHETGPPGMTGKRYEQLLSVYEEVYGHEHPEVGELLSNMGSFYCELGNYERSVRLLERSVTILERNLGSGHPSLAPALHNLATAYLHSGGRDQEAMALLERCIHVREQVQGPGHESLAMPLRQLAYARVKLGMLDDAVAALQRVTDIEETWLADVISQGSEEQKTDWSELWQGRCNATLAFQAQYGAGDARATKLALTALLRMKGRKCDALAASMLNLRKLDDAESLRLREQWSSLLTAEAEWYAAKLAEADELPFKVRRDAEFDRLRVAREDTERAIARKTSTVTLSAAAADADTVQRRIAADTALIEFYRLTLVDLHRISIEIRDDAAPTYVAFVLRSSGSPFWVDLGSAGLIDDSINSLCHTSMGSEARWRKAARELDQLLLEPIRPLLGGASHLLIVPDSEIFRVPFAALVDPSGRYEVLNHTHTYLTSGRDLLRPSASRYGWVPPLILAAADFASVNISDQTVLVKRRSTGPSFEPLEHTLEEGRLVQALLPGSELRTGSNATKQSIQRTRGPSILHIASHGFWHPDVRDKSDILIDSFSGAALPSPLVRSGIALAGANRFQDGLLTALEISALDLRGTELVTLSACETGLGDLSSTDGVYGLRRAVMLAGAESLLVSLFQVPDDSTKSLMEAYYRRLLAHRGRSEALREVQIEILNDRLVHPIDWGAFILIGRSEPLSGTTQPVKGDAPATLLRSLGDRR
jgi:CHAT domain-containing protein/tetratricopeptide (TPR) repeat protein